MVWNATCPDTFAPSHITLAMKEAGAVADKAEQQKYFSLMIGHHFVPIAIETSGVRLMYHIFLRAWPTN